MTQSTYRYSFIYRLQDLEGNIKHELDTWISNYKKQEEKFEQDDATRVGSLYTFTTDVFIQENALLLVPVQIIVFYNGDYLDFIEDILRFNSTFPDHKVERQYIHTYAQKDEYGILDDFIEENNNG